MAREPRNRRVFRPSDPKSIVLAGIAAGALSVTLGTRAADAHQSPCWEVGRSTSSTVQTDERGDLRMRVANEECTAEMRVEGEVRFTEDFRGVAGVSPGGLVRIAEDERGTERRLEVRRGEDGSPEYEYRLDGRARPFDAEARAWLAETLLVLFRRTGYAAEERVAWLLSRDGAAGVLREVEHITSSSAARRYLGYLLARSPDDDTAIRALELAARRISSSSQLGDLLASVAESRRLEGAVAEAWLRGVQELSSSSARRKALSAALDVRPVDRDLVLRIVREAEDISSSSAQRDVLRAALDAAEGDEEVLAAVLRASEGVSSSSARGSILERAGEARLTSLAVQEAYLGSVAGISSSSVKRKTLQRLVTKDGVTADELALALVAGRSIGSSSELADLLVTVARRHTLEGPLREAYLTAAREVSSRSERERALAALGGS